MPPPKCKLFYSLRSLMIVVLVLPPLLAWAGAPLYRWLTTPKQPKQTEITKPYTTAPQPGIVDPRETVIGYPGSEARWKEIQANAQPPVIIDDLDILPNFSAPAPNPPKP